MEETQKMRIGWIGPGKMGLPMARHVHNAGHDLLVFARSAGSKRKSEDAGLAATDDLSSLVRASDAVFSTISDDGALTEIVIGPGGWASTAKDHQIFVEMSTVSPTCSAKVAAALQPTGAAYLRAPVSGSTATAEAAGLTTIVSGPTAAYDRVRNVIGAFSRQQFLVGSGDEARYLKLVLNAMVGATSALLAEALALGRKGGLDMATMLEVVCQSAVASPLIGYKRDMIVSGDYDPQFAASQMVKDLDLILGSGHSAHVPMHLISGVRESFETALAQGHGNDDFFVLVDLQKRLVGA